MKKFIAVMLICVLTFSLGTGSFAATNKKQSILSEMQSAAEELGVQNSVTYQNAYASVANYEGTITDEQYQAALAEIQTIKDAIASKGVEAVRNDQTLMNELIAHVVAAAEAVGITIVYEGDGIGFVSSNSAGNSDGKPSYSDPIKQTGLDYSATWLMAAGIAIVFGSCVLFARKKQLFV